jgi:hypothetical protein
VTTYATPMPAHHRDAHSDPNDLTDFGFGAGLPSINVYWSPDDRLCEEDFLVDGLRGYLSAIASQCHRATPVEYEDFIADLTEVDSGDAPTRRSVRFTHLLHTYADYIPAPDCDYLDLSAPGYHGWVSSIGRVVFDIVTTLTWTELAAADDESLVRTALRAGADFGYHFAGVRLIVLDAPFESSFYYPNDAGQPLRSVPLHMMDGAQ